MYVVDASVWVSRFVPGDVYHPVSSQWLRGRIDREELVVAPVLLLVEVAGAVARRSGAGRAGASAMVLMQRLPNARFSPIDNEFAEQGARVAADLRLRGADALYVALAWRLGIPLVTWDREQQERGRERVTVLRPDQAIER